MPRTIITTADVISSITKALRTEFTTTEAKAVYKDSQKQNFKTACLFVDLIESERSYGLTGSGFVHNILDVRAHPAVEEEEVESWCVKMGDRIIGAIGIVPVDGLKIKATKITLRRESGVLHCLLEYSYRVRFVETPAPKMSTITININ